MSGTTARFAVAFALLAAFGVSADNAQCQDDDVTGLLQTKTEVDTEKKNEWGWRAAGQEDGHIKVVFDHDEEETVTRKDRPEVMKAAVLAKSADKENRPHKRNLDQGSPSRAKLVNKVMKATTDTNKNGKIERDEFDREVIRKLAAHGDTIIKQVIKEDNKIKAREARKSHLNQGINIVDQIKDRLTSDINRQVPNDVQWAVKTAAGMALEALPIKQEIEKEVKKTTGKMPQEWRTLAQTAVREGRKMGKFQAAVFEQQTHFDQQKRSREAAEYKKAESIQWKKAHAEELYQNRTKALIAKLEAQPKGTKARVERAALRALHHTGHNTVYKPASMDKSTDLLPKSVKVMDLGDEVALLKKQVKAAQKKQAEREHDEQYEKEKHRKGGPGCIPGSRCDKKHHYQHHHGR